MQNCLSKKRKVGIFDIESDGLYWEVTQTWCMYIFDAETEEEWGFKPDEIEQAIAKLKEFDVVCGHNVIDYDLPALAKMYPELMEYEWEVFDTLILSRYLQPDRSMEEIRGHSLKAWGLRLGEYKGEYGEETENAWAAFSEEMFKYCRQDVNLTLIVYRFLCKLAGFDPLDPPTIMWKQ